MGSNSRGEVGGQVADWFAYKNSVGSWKGECSHRSSCQRFVFVSFYNHFVGTPVPVLLVSRLGLPFRSSQALAGGLSRSMSVSGFRPGDFSHRYPSSGESRNPTKLSAVSMTSAASLLLTTIGRACARIQQRWRGRAESGCNNQGAHSLPQRVLRFFFFWIPFKTIFNNRKHKRKPHQLPQQVLLLSLRDSFQSHIEKKHTTKGLLDDRWFAGIGGSPFAVKPWTDRGDVGKIKCYPVFLSA